VGGTSNDYVDTSSSTKIGEAYGYVSTASGVNTEADTGLQGGTGTNYYSLDDTTNIFTISGGTYYGYNGEVQFLFVNNPGASVGYVYIQYWLLNYINNPPFSCPGGWTQAPRSTYCYMNSVSYNTTEYDPSGVLNYALKGYADYGPMNLDESIFCVSGIGCWGSGVTYTEEYLSSSWTSSEWNLFGYGSGSGACINGTPSGGLCPTPSGSPSLGIVQNLYDSSGNSISSITCTMQASNVREYNSLTLGSCTPVGGSSYFTET
jgi:hypothetical protein